MDNPIDKVLEAFDRAGCRPKDHKTYWQAYSPLRDEQNPSLTIRVGEDGRVLIKDHGAPNGKDDTPAIMEKIGLSMADLFPSNGTNGHHSTPKQKNLTKIDWGRPGPAYLYNDQHGQPYLKKQRFPITDQDGVEVDKSFIWYHWDGHAWQKGKGEKRSILYNLKALKEAEPGQPVMLCEGEKDADNMIQSGFLATTKPSTTEDIAKYISDLKSHPVIIFEDNDTAGHVRAQNDAAQLAHATEVRIITPKLGGWHKIAKGDVSDVITGVEPNEVQMMVNNWISKAPTWEPEAEPPAAGELASEPVFKAYSLAQFLTRPKKEWIIKNLIGKADLAMLFGEAGTGKTFVTLDLLFSAALGLSFAGKFQPVRPLNVVYCAGEGVEGLPNRFAAALGKYGKSPEEMPLTILTNVPQLFDNQIETNVYTFVRDLSEQTEQIDLIVIDTLYSAALGADENHAKDAGVILAAIRHIRDTLGCAVLLDHHTNRAGGYRGSSAWHGAMDMMIQTHPEGPIFKLDCFKPKDAEKFQPAFFRLAPDRVSESVYVEWLEAETVHLNDEKSAVDIAESAIIELLAEKSGLNQTEIVDTLKEKVGRQTVLKALKKLEAGGEVQAIQKGNRKLYQLKMDL